MSRLIMEQNGQLYTHSRVSINYDLWLICHHDVMTAGISSLIRRAAAREGNASRHHRTPIKTPLLKPPLYITTILYSGVSGAPSIGAERSMTKTPVWTDVPVTAHYYRYAYIYINLLMNKIDALQKFCVYKRSSFIYWHMRLVQNNITIIMHSLHCIIYIVHAELLYIVYTES